jgi:hypothetical protein
MARRSITIAVLCVGGLISCYAPAHWQECYIRCSSEGACPVGAACAGDGYCHRSGGKSCVDAGGGGGVGGGTGDVTPPSFAGASSATPGINTIVLGWSAASDDFTPAAQITYLIYQAAQPGYEDFMTPVATTAPGATAFSVPGLAPSTLYYFVVRARDQAGNIDQNQVEVAAQTLAGSDTTPPQFGGVQRAQATVANAVELSWTAAVDDITAPADMVYLAYAATSAGGEDFRTPTAISAAGVTTLHVGGLTAGMPYFFVVRARDQAGNIDMNHVERSATPFPDKTPPVFAGATNATATSLTTIRVTWRPASDDVTPASRILYDVYSSLSSGHESFASPTTTSAPGAFSVDVGGLLPLTTYFFVVRARDQAGNSDANTVEVSASTPLL